MGRVAAFGDQVVDLLGDDAGLATARTGEHEQGGTDVLHRLELAGIEILHRNFRRKREQAAGHGRWYCPTLYTTRLIRAAISLWGQIDRMSGLFANSITFDEIRRRTINRLWGGTRAA